jgi:hypothetical protein
MVLAVAWVGEVEAGTGWATATLYKGACSYFGIGVYRVDKGQFQNIPNDRVRSLFVPPGFVVDLWENEADGNRSGDHTICDGNKDNGHCGWIPMPFVWQRKTVKSNGRPNTEAIQFTRSSGGSSYTIYD